MPATQHDATRNKPPLVVTDYLPKTSSMSSSPEGAAVVVHNGNVFQSAQVAKTRKAQQKSLGPVVVLFPCRACVEFVKIFEIVSAQNHCDRVRVESPINQPIFLSPIITVTTRYDQIKKITPNRIRNKLDILIPNFYIYL